MRHARLPGRRGAAAIRKQGLLPSPVGGADLVIALAVDLYQAIAHRHIHRDVEIIVAG